MATCKDLKKGDVFVCEECGVELQVIKECQNNDKSSDILWLSFTDCCAFCCGGKSFVKKDILGFTPTST